MASIQIYVISATPATSTVTWDGLAYIAGNSTAWSWSIETSHSDLATGINDAMKTAAIDAAETGSGLTVGALDKKTLFSGAIGL